MSASCASPLPPPRAPQDPSFDLLLASLFGDVAEFEQQMLEPSTEVLERAKVLGRSIAQVRCGAPWVPRPGTAC